MELVFDIFEHIVIVGGQIWRIRWNGSNSTDTIQPIFKQYDRFFYSCEWHVPRCGCLVREKGFFVLHLVLLQWFVLSRFIPWNAKIKLYNIICFLIFLFQSSQRSVLRASQHTYFITWPADCWIFGRQQTADFIQV